jgi:hypothetical protein
MGSIIFWIIFSSYFNPSIIKNAGNILFVGGIGFPFLILLYAKKYSKKEFYNPLMKIVEIHIGRKGSPAKLLTSVKQSVKLAEKMNTNVIFYTNHFPEERLLYQNKFNIKVKKASLLQKISYYIPFWLITLGKKKGKIYPLLRCEIIVHKE